MFCPICKSEFRAGFTRCATCDADLVEDLSPSTATEAKSPPQAVTACSADAFRDFCGFLSLDDARRARARLREASLAGEIVIRDRPGKSGTEEEYWLRVPGGRFREAEAILGYDEAEEIPAETYTCSDCGREVAAEETFCPYCGARFEED